MLGWVWFCTPERQNIIFKVNYKYNNLQNYTLYYFYETRMNLNYLSIHLILASKYNKEWRQNLN